MNFPANWLCVRKLVTSNTFKIWTMLKLSWSIFSRKHIDTTPVDSVEFIFDYDDDFDRLLQIIHVVVKRVDHYEEKDEYPLLALEMRFMAYRFAHALSRDLVYSHTRYKL